MNTLKKNSIQPLNITLKNQMTYKLHYLNPVRIKLNLTLVFIKLRMNVSIQLKKVIGF